MGIWIIRIFFIILSMTFGYFIGPKIYEAEYARLYGIAAGGVVALFAILVERAIKRGPIKAILGGLIGLILGLLLGNLFSGTILKGMIQASPPLAMLGMFINLLFGYMGMALGIKKAEEINITNLSLMGKEKPRGHYKILDTSVIIDGRIADVCETGFIEGTLVIPQYILQELQHIADSSDSIKRTRGRRGLDILNRIQKQVEVEVKVVEQDFPKIKEVDAKLVALAKSMTADIITNDFNLNKVAELQGIKVLNINKLANALKPVVLPGEIMKVRIIKEGKEQGQGIGYLDDGTMVVVDSAIKYLGKSIDVAVTSVLQTTAGRMIFTVLKDEMPQDFYQNAGYSSHH